MIHLTGDEKVLMVLHKHWIALLGKAVAVIFFAIGIPSILLLALRYANFDLGYLTPFVLFFLIIYLMIVVVFFFMVWVVYYLDMWIITSNRIIDIHQLDLFRREITEFNLDKIQDITVEIPDMMATFLKYGNLILETAGESTFKITQIPNIYKAKDLILDLTGNKKENVGAQ